MNEVNEITQRLASLDLALNKYVGNDLSSPGLSNIIFKDARTLYEKNLIDDYELYLEHLWNTYIKGTEESAAEDRAMATVMYLSALAGLLDGNGN